MFSRGGGGLFRLARLHAAPLLGHLASAWKGFRKANTRAKQPSSAAQKQLDECSAPAPIYIPPHKMAPAPPRNKYSDWLIPQRPAACPAPTRRACAELGKARSHCGWEGQAAFAGSWKARETLLPAGCSPAGGRGGAPLLGSAFFSMPVSEFHAAFRLGPQPRPRRRTYSFPFLPLCVASRLRARYVVSRSPPAIPQSSAFRRPSPAPAGSALLPSGGDGALRTRLQVFGRAGLHFPVG